MKPTKTLCSFLLASALLAVTSTAQAADAIWDGGGGNNSWGTANNWNPDGVPSFDATTDVLFNGTVRINPNHLEADRTIRSITFNANGATNIRLSTTHNGNTGVQLTLGDASNAPTITNNATTSGTGTRTLVRPG